MGRRDYRGTTRRSSLVCQWAGLMLPATVIWWIMMGAPALGQPAGGVPPAFAPQGQPRPIESAPVVVLPPPLPSEIAPTEPAQRELIEPPPAESDADESARITLHPLDRLIDHTSDSRTLLSQ